MVLSCCFLRAVPSGKIRASCKTLTVLYSCKSGAHEEKEEQKEQMRERGGFSQRCAAAVSCSTPQCHT